MYFLPWSSSSFPISSETGRGLTLFSLPGLTIATPQIKLWLLLAFFLLEIFCFTSTKDRSKAKLTTIGRTTSVTNPSVYRVRTTNLDQNPEHGKHSPCSSTSKIRKLQKFPQSPTSCSINHQKPKAYHRKRSIGPNPEQGKRLPCSPIIQKPKSHKKFGECSATLNSP